MNDHELDLLMKTPLLKVPKDFEGKVVHGIATRPNPLVLSKPRSGIAFGASTWRLLVREALQWLALLLGGGLAFGIAFSQVFGFMFGLWLTTQAH